MFTWPLLLLNNNATWMLSYLNWKKYLFLCLASKNETQCGQCINLERVNTHVGERLF